MRLQLKDGITLYLARHGETQANRDKRFSGRKDTPLTDTGRTQALAVGEILLREVGPRPPLEFVSSPLRRARTTMDMVLTVLDLPRGDYATDARIEEINLGAWDQLTEAEARAQDPVMFAARAADKWDVRVPEGENYADVASRAMDWATSLTRDTFAVSHGALIRILRGLFLGLDWRGMSDLDEPQGVVFRVREDQVARLD